MMITGLKKKKKEVNLNILLLSSDMTTCLHRENKEKSERSHKQTPLWSNVIAVLVIFRLNLKVTENKDWFQYWGTLFFVSPENLSKTVAWSNFLPRSLKIVFMLLWARKAATHQKALNQKKHKGKLTDCKSKHYKTQQQ